MQGSGLGSGSGSHTPCTQLAFLEKACTQQPEGSVALLWGHRKQASIRLQGHLIGDPRVNFLQSFHLGESKDQWWLPGTTPAAFRVSGPSCISLSLE